jgi:protein-S-isoprenylcysteine O-methyltransferase Ste14
MRSEILSVWLQQLNSDLEEEKEFPHSHLIQGVMPVVFLTIWALHSFVFRFSTFLSALFPLTIRLLLFFAVFIMALVLIQLSHKTLFGERHGHPDKVINSGIMAHVCHPMYLGVLLIYVAVFLTTLSLICLFLAVFIVYDRMASFEDKQLEIIFSEDSVRYRSGVRKWIPG